MKKLLDKLQHLEDRYEELNALMSNPDIINNPTELQKHAKAQADLTDIVEAYRNYKKVLAELDEAKAMLDDKLDPEMKEMVELEIEELEERKEKLEEELKILLLPKDPNDEKTLL